MDFISTRIITGDVARLAGFYERVTGARAHWSGPDFAEIRTARAALAIASTRTVPLFAPGAARPGANQSVIVEFLVDDVDAVGQNLSDFADVVAGPATMPWGNRSLLFRDPDGNLVNFFTPVTPAAVAKFATNGCRLCDNVQPSVADDPVVRQPRR
jgi:catechol 2,3-dioxygenase-like lactoylglutathione lyase family enzyme